MDTNIVTDGGYNVAIMNDNHIMTGSAASPWRRILRAPFTRRSWAEFVYTLVTLPVAIAGVVYTAVTVEQGFLWALSASGMHKLASANRYFARELLGEDVPAPPAPGPTLAFKVRTPDAARLAGLVVDADGTTRVWEGQAGLTSYNLPQYRITELAAEAGIKIDDIQPRNAALNWMRGRAWSPVAWRARAYFALKLPLSVVGLVAAAGCWLGGVFCLAFPVWWAFLPQFRIVPLGPAFSVFPISAALLLVAAPWLMHGTAEADRRLVRGLLGPSTHAERIRALEESRAHAVDDSAARLRGIERDLHDGTQAQLVALGMKLGLAREKLDDGSQPDLARVTQLVEDAHRGVIEAIADLRTLARGIHPPVLDNGLADALATLAERSAVPVELVIDIPERPSDAIETIAYFSAAELLTNVAKHSGARHATVEAVHVLGLLRIRVTDDGNGGARPFAGGGLRGLADRVRTVDGRLEVDSPSGGPTTITVELPSHA
ncbi:MAG: sensor domain-containing protein [Streptosporangiaceae bacterium]|jgi:signal transduction histidine kinase